MTQRRPIDTAPLDGTRVKVWASLPEHLQWADQYRRILEIECEAAYHPDVGWCIGELREATHWEPLDVAEPKGKHE